MTSVELVLLIGALLILLSIAIAKLFDNLGVPTLILFIGIGMLAGSEGPGNIYFDDAQMAQSIGIIALIFILFAGGVDTRWDSVKSLAFPAASLATIGVLLTAVLVGSFIHIVLNIPLPLGILIGSIISSTDAAAVFSILRAKNLKIKEKTQALLELESGSNDPMAVFLTIGCIQYITIPGKDIFDIILLFLLQMGLGGLAGLILGNLMVYLLNRLKFSYEGIYPVFSLAFIIAGYGLISLVNGSGFLAVYIMGLIAGNSSLVYKKGTIRFFDGLAWLSQIAMFLTLGLLVFPSQILNVTVSGLLVSAFLILVARPLSVFITLQPFKFDFKEKAFISWVGLRGAVPIILATFPLLAGIHYAETIFNVVFFIVITSTLLQGWLITPVAKFLKVDTPPKIKRNYPIEFNPTEDVDTELIDLIVPYNGDAAGKPIVQLGFPNDARIVLIWRNEKSIIPSGGTLLEEGDTVLVLVNKDNVSRVKEIFSKQKI
jgi:cell volume regulation protein A